jgi:hypothetical protein
MTANQKKTSLTSMEAKLRPVRPVHLHNEKGPTVSTISVSSPALLPKDLNDVTKDAIARAVDRGWMLLERHHSSACLTDAAGSCRGFRVNPEKASPPATVALLGARRSSVEVTLALCCAFVFAIDIL